MGKLQFIAFLGAMGAAGVIWFFAFRFLFAALYGIPIIAIEPNPFIASIEASILFCVGGFSVIAGFWVLTRITRIRGPISTILLLLILLSAFLFVGAYLSTGNLTPPPNTLTPPTSQKIGSVSSGLGSSVDISYQVQNKTIHEVDPQIWSWAGVDMYGDFHESAFGYMLSNDTGAWCYYIYGCNLTSIFASIDFKMASPYVSVSKCYYAITTYTYDTDDFKSGVANDAYAQIYILGEGVYQSDTSAVEQTYQCGTFTLSSSYISDGYIHGRFDLEFEDTDGEMDWIKFFVRQLCFEYDTVEETVRSSYSVVGGTNRYAVSWTIWDYNVNATLTAPSDWTFQDINPDCDVTSNEFECLVPEDYEAIYTVDVLASANWGEVFSWSFEDDGNEFVTVLDGAASYDLGTSYYNFTESYTTESWIVWSAYGSATLDYASGSSVTVGSSGYWTTTVTYASSIDYLNFTGTNVIIDSIGVYQSSVTTGSTISGSCIHVHPNGYVGAPYVTVHLGLWNSSNLCEEYASATTDSDGDWTFDTDDFSTSLTSQTYRLWTWIYVDANGAWDRDAVTESITDWSSSYSTTSITNTTEDTYVEQNQPTTNYGSWNWFLVSTKTGQQKRSFLKFDLSIYSSSLESAVLWVYRDGGSSGTDVDAHEVSNTTWLEEDLTWNDQPSYNATAIDNYTGSYGTYWFDLDITSWARTCAGGNCSVALTGAYFYISICSKEGTYDPYLLISLTQDGVNSTSTDRQEGSYSVLAEVGGNEAIMTYNSTNFDGSGLVTFELQINDTDTINEFVYMVDSSGKSIKDALGDYPSWTEDAWTFFAIPMFSTYGWDTWTSSFDASDIDYWRVDLDDTGAEADRAIYVDSLNFLHYYSNDSLTYPFSVDVSTTLWMVFKRGTGQVIPWGTFICYVDDEVRPEPYAEITGTTTTGTSHTVNITLVDDFGQLIYQDTSYAVEDSGNTFLRETLQVYILNLANQREKPQYAIVTRDGETFTSPDIGAYSSFPYLVYGSGAGVTYTVSWYRAEDGELTDTFTWTVYSSDVTAYSGFDPPVVVNPGVDPNPLIYAFISTLIWTSFLQIILTFGGLVVLGVLLRRKRVPELPTIGAPDEGDSTTQVSTSPSIERENQIPVAEDVRKRGEQARKTRGKMKKSRG